MKHLRQDPGIMELVGVRSIEYKTARTDILTETWNGKETNECGETKLTV